MSTIMAEYRAKRADEDRQIHERLKNAVEHGVVEIHTDQRMLDFQGSPVHSPWDHLVPLMVLMFFALAVLLFAGVAIGIVAMTMGVFAHVYGVKYLIAWRIRARTTAYLLESAAHWQHLWHLGGIVVLLKGTNEYCMAPQGDWRKFVRRNLADDPENPVAAAQPQAQPKPQPKPAQTLEDELAKPWHGDTVEQEILPP